MTVRELSEKLKAFAPELPVYVTAPERGQWSTGSDVELGETTYLSDENVVKTDAVVVIHDGADW